MNVVQKLKSRFVCERFAPLLVPFAEGTLPAPERAKVSRHLRGCAFCEAQVAQTQAVAALLRAHVPAAPAPAPDLWSRIEAQITPAGTPVPVATPVLARQVALASAQPVNQWRAFWLTFVPGGATVAAAAVGVLWISGHKANTPASSSPAPALPVLAAKSGADTLPPVIMEFRTVRRVAKANPVNAKPHVQATTKIAPIAPSEVIAKRASASPVLSRPLARTVRVAIANPVPTPSAHKSHEIARESRTPSSRFYASRVMRPRVSDAAVITVVDVPKPQATPLPVLPYEPARDTVRVVSVNPPANAEVSPDAVLERDVPATLSASTLSEQLQRQQSLFSYASYAP